MARVLRSSRVASVLILSLVLGGLAVPARAADVPAKGTEILWDRYGIPHIFAPDHPSLFYAYGYAQMEAHAELLVRLYAQARGRGAEFYGEQYLADDRWVRTNGLPALAKQWAAGQSAEFAPLIQAFAAGLNAWAAEHKSDLSAAAQAVLPLTVEDVYAHGLRTIHFDWVVSPPQARAATHSLRQRRARVQRMGHRAVALRLGQGAAVEQLAPAVGRHPHLFRGAAERARRHLVRRRVGRVPGPAPVLHGVRRLDADDEQPVRVGPLPPRAQGRRLRPRWPGQAVRDAHRVDQGPRGRTDSCARCRSRSAAAYMGRSSPSAVGRRLPCAWPPSIGRGSSSSSGAWAWRRTWPSGKPRCGCSSSRSSTRPTPTATGTSCTSTTPRCPCTRPATTASGREWCPATARISSPRRSTRGRPCPRSWTRRPDGCRTRTTCRGPRSTRWCSIRRSSRPASRRPRASPSGPSAGSGS